MNRNHRGSLKRGGDDSLEGLTSPKSSKSLVSCKRRTVLQPSENDHTSTTDSPHVNSLDHSVTTVDTFDAKQTVLTSESSTEDGRVCDKTPSHILKDLNQTKSRLLEKVKAKEEQLRKLEMVKMYRTKNNLEELGGLIEKWRGVSKSALNELLELIPGETKPTLEELVAHFGIDPNLLQLTFEKDKTPK